MKPIKLTGTHGAPVIINPECFAFMSQAVTKGIDGESPAHTLIVYPGGQSIQVTETAEEIWDELNKSF
jgi:hypothetical protein